MPKKCFYCGSNLVIKYGRKGQSQRYLCKSCGKCFIPRKELMPSELYHEYVFGKRMVSELSAFHGISLGRDMPWLWTSQEHPALGMPNTNNAMEGFFTDLRQC